jgi:hypothetical protein
MRSVNQKAFRALSIVILSSLLLVGTHLGEFWPMSIYPMFSQAGKPWQRGLVISTSAETFHSTQWDTLSTLTELPGSVVALDSYDIPQNDFANFIHKTPVWTLKKQQALHHIFTPVDKEHLLIYRVVGRLNVDEKVIYEFIPMMKSKGEQWKLNPALSTIETSASF